MSLFIFRFWPVFIPLLVYYVWMKTKQVKATKAGDEPPRFRDGPLYRLVITMLLTAIGCYVWVGTHHKSVRGDYVPPRMEDGRIIPGGVVPQQDTETLSE